MNTVYMLTFNVTYSYLVQSMQLFLFIHNAISFNIFYYSNMSSCRFRCCHGPWHTGLRERPGGSGDTGNTGFTGFIDFVNFGIFKADFTWVPLT